MKKIQGIAIQAITPSNIKDFVILSGGTPLSSLKAFIIITKIPPRNSPPIQLIEDDTSGGTGCVNSTLNSSASGNKQNEAAPNTAQRIHIPVYAFGRMTQMKAR
jgi:hypothetical protein